MTRAGSPSRCADHASGAFGLRPTSSEGAASRLGTVLRALALCAVSLVALRGGGACAADPSDAQQAAVEIAAQVAAAHRAGRTADVEELANRQGVDPWEIADELQAAGAADAALALAKAIRIPAERLELESVLGAPGLVDDAANVPRSAWRAASIVAGPQEREAALRPLADRLAEGGSIYAARVLLSHAGALEALGAEPQAQLDAWDRVLEMARRLKWGRLEMHSAYECVLLHDAAGRTEAATDLLQAALVLVKGRERFEDAGNVMLARAVFHARSSEYTMARLRFADAAECFRMAGVPAGEAQAMAYLGGLLATLGRLLEAMVAIDRAAEVAKQLTDAELGAIVSDQRAIVLEAAALYEDARAAHTASRRLLTDAGLLTAARAARIEGNLHRIAFLERRYDAASEHLGTAERGFAEAKLTPELRSCLAHRAWLESETQLAEKTVNDLAAALEVPAEETTHEEVATLCEALARCRMRQGRHPEAVALLERARDQTLSLEKGDPLRTDVAGGYAVALWAAGRSKEALVAFDAYVDGLLGVADEMALASARTYRGIVADEALSGAIQAALAVKDDERLWRYMEASRAIRLLAALGGRSALDEAIVPAEVTAAYDASLRRLAAARRTQVLANLPPLRPEARERKTLVAELKAAEAERDAVVARMVLARSGGIRVDVGATPDLLSLERMRRALASDGSEVVVSLVRLGEEKKLVGMVVSRGAPPVVTLQPDAGELAAACAELRRHADVGWVAEQPPPKDPAEMAARAALPDALLERIRGAVDAVVKVPDSARCVYVIPHAELAYVPYTAIWPGRTVQLMPCASLIPVLRQPERRAGSVGLAIGVSDYRYGGLLKGPGAAIAALTPGGTRSANISLLGPLPKAADEAKEVAGKQGVPLLEHEATAERLVDELRKGKGRRWSTVHFACHGLVNADLPSLSGVAMFDSVLTAQEIFGLRMSTDMVVLSACNTATDAYVVGEGVAGLVRAFFQAGAPRVVASLWKVPDEPTAALMGRFYRLLADSPTLAPADALRMAQEHVRTLDGGKWASPVNWAAWVVWGAR